MVSFQIVDNLHNGFVFRRCAVKDERIACFNNGEPLPVGMKIGRKRIKQRTVPDRLTIPTFRVTQLS